MNALEWFRLAVRLTGLVFLYRGLEALPISGVQFIAAFFRSDFEGVLNCLIHGAWPLAVGYWLILGAPWLVTRAFPESKTVAKP